MPYLTGPWLNITLLFPKVGDSSMRLFSTLRGVILNSVGFFPDVLPGPVMLRFQHIITLNVPYH